MGRAAKKYVLVVDDDDNFRAIAGDLLRHAGYEVLCLSCARVALSVIARRQPALILLDLRMPRMSGWEFLEVKRRQPKLARVPVILVSAYLDDQPLLEEDVCLAIQKPVDPDLLLRTVEKICPRERSETNVLALSPAS
jgi:CheY-like chemotaxis protein